MKSLLPTLALPALLAGGLALAAPVGQDPAEGVQDGRAELERELGRLRARADELDSRVALQGALLEETLDYLQRHAAATVDLLPVLDKAEEQGFTAGINWESRETLLAGWRAWAAASGKGVPGTPSPPEESGERAGR